VEKSEAWGPVGHSLVARIGATFLKPEVKQLIKDLLPWYVKGDLSMVSSWPDNIIYDDSNPVGFLNWQWTRELHYVNTPDWLCTYEPSRDCKNNWCVDGAIQNYTNRLIIDQFIDDLVQQQEAIQFLVHYVGDVHQPLHAGFTTDKGGNDVKGIFMNGTRLTNLHSLWDAGIIAQRLQELNITVDHYFDYLLNLMNTNYSSNISEWQQCPSDRQQFGACSTLWIYEDSKILCSTAYIDESGNVMNETHNFTLNEGYYNRVWPIIEQRLIQGGVRLGNMFNLIGERLIQNKQKKKHDKKRVFVWRYNCVDCRSCCSSSRCHCGYVNFCSS